MFFNAHHDANYQALFTKVAPQVTVSIAHLPMAYPALRSAMSQARLEEKEGAKLRRQQHRCQMPGCHFRSTFYCIQCNKCLCITFDRMCFTEYHKTLREKNKGDASTSQAPSVVAPSVVTSGASTTPLARHDTDELEEKEEPVQPRNQPRRSAKRSLPEERAPPAKRP